MLAFLEGNIHLKITLHLHFGRLNAPSPSWLPLCHRWKRLMYVNEAAKEAKAAYTHLSCVCACVRDRDRERVTASVSITTYSSYYKKPGNLTGT